MAVNRTNRAPKPQTSKVANCDLGETRANSVESVKHQIFVIRGQRVMFDHDLAKLYGVATKRLNEQLRRNIKRFPKDFAFQLTLAEAKEIMPSRLQFATLKKGHNIKHPPHVFTEPGSGRYSKRFELSHKNGERQDCETESPRILLVSDCSTKSTRTTSSVRAGNVSCRKQCSRGPRAPHRSGNSRCFWRLDAQ